MTNQSDGLLPTTCDRVLIAHNPRAGRRSALADIGRLVALVEQSGLHVDTCTDLDEVAARANHWHADGELRALVGVGGDGTAAELANRTHPGVPLTLLPRGTENLLARYLCLGRRPEQAWQTILAGRTGTFDAGSANGRVFLLMASCGFDAAVVQMTHAARTGHIRRLSYLKPILSCLRSYHYPELRVELELSAPHLGAPQQDASPLADGNGAGKARTGETEAPEIEARAPQEGQNLAPDRPPNPAVTSRCLANAEAFSARWVFVCNLPCYAAGLRPAPAACGTDGSLDVCTFSRGSLWHGLRFVASVALGRHQRLADCRMLQALSVVVSSTDEVGYQLDGDFGGMLPLAIRILPKRLTLLLS